MKRNFLAIGAAMIIAAGFFLYEVFLAPNTFDGDRFVIVSKGEKYPQVVDSLQKNGVVRSRFLLNVAGRLLGYTTKIQIGKYRFKSGMSNKEILADLRYGTTVELITMTVGEGMKATRLARLFARNLGADSSRFMNAVTDTMFVKSLGVGANTLEGYLMPETYAFYWQTDEGTVIKTMVAAFHKVFNDTLVKRAKSLGLSVGQVLSIASIVEGETSVDSERALIAGVYYNRLKKGMRLQADPTVQYIIENGPRRLTKNDLQIESAYNTYRHAGLPPGPINNPGKSAILAALYPKKHKYLYFVATGEGGHKFSRTYAEHQHAVRLYRKWKELQEAMKKEKQPT